MSRIASRICWLTYSLLVRAASRVAYGPSRKMCSCKEKCRLGGVWCVVAKCRAGGACCAKAEKGLEWKQSVRRQVQCSSRVMERRPAGAKSIDPATRGRCC